MRRLLQLYLVTLALLPGIASSGPDLQRLLTAPGSNHLAVIRKAYNLPGLTYGEDHGAGFASQVTGVRKVGNPTSIESHDQFHLGSLSKAMTATLLAIMIKDGHFSWSSKFSDLLPELSTQLHIGHSETTLDMLTSHHSGIYINYAHHPRTWRHLFLNSASLVERRRHLAAYALTRPPVNGPGQFLYDNTNFVIAGAIIDRHSNTTWEDLIQTHLFEPLGMTGCGFGPNTESSANSVDNPWPHVSLSRTMAPIPVSFLPYSRRDNPPPINPSGRVHCPMISYNSFLRAHIDGARGIDSAALNLSAVDFRPLHTPYTGSNQSSALYTPGAWGWTAGDNDFVLIHEGSNGYNQAIAKLEPSKNRSSMTMTNLGGERADDATRAVLRFRRTGPDLKKAVNPRSTERRH